MRLNKFIAAATGMSRRAADNVIKAGRVSVNGGQAQLNHRVQPTDNVALDANALQLPEQHTYMLNKPPGYVCSRQGQGSHTIYDLLPAELVSLKPIGRLDKDSSGLLLLTNDGDLANRLLHPRFAKTKIYEVIIDKPLLPIHGSLIADEGVPLEDGPSQLKLDGLDSKGLRWRVTMHEGRNRQIRRTFAALGYRVTALHRVQFGDYVLGSLKVGKYLKI